MKSRFDFSVVMKIVDIIKKREIDIIHTHGYKSDILGIIAARIAGIRTISTPHGFGLAEDFKLRLFIKTGGFILQFFDKVVPLSRQLKQEVIDLGVSERKIEYIRNGVDLLEVDKYRKLRGTKPEKGEKKIGFIGQMIPRKNIQDILQVFDRVQKVIPDSQLLLLGDGESRSEMERFSSNLASVDHIQFLGFRHDRMDYLKDMDLFVMTSRDEGIPRCLMEAMGMEVPVAAYDIPGVDQLVTHNKTGLLAEFGDIDTLSEYWIQLLTNQKMAKNLAKEGRIFVNYRFSARRMAEEYCALFSNILEDGNT